MRDMWPFLTGLLLGVFAGITFNEWDRGQAAHWVRDRPEAPDA